jgi:hypothetical protein
MHVEASRNLREEYLSLAARKKIRFLEAGRESR